MNAKYASARYDLKGSFLSLNEFQKKAPVMVENKYIAPVMTQNKYFAMSKWAFIKLDIEQIEA